MLLSTCCSKLEYGRSFVFCSLEYLESLNDMCQNMSTDGCGSWSSAPHIQKRHCWTVVIIIVMANNRVLHVISVTYQLYVRYEVSYVSIWCQICRVDDRALTSGSVLLYRTAVWEEFRHGTAWPLWAPLRLMIMRCVYQADVMVDFCCNATCDVEHGGKIHEESLTSQAVWFHVSFLFQSNMLTARVSCCHRHASHNAADHDYLSSVTIASDEENRCRVAVCSRSCCTAN